MPIVSHRTAFLMVCLLVAVQFTIESCSPTPLRKVRDEAEEMIDPGPKVWLRPPPISTPAPIPLSKRNSVI
jgi:hypothetical protein